MPTAEKRNGASSTESLPGADDKNGSMHTMSDEVLAMDSYGILKSAEDQKELRLSKDQHKRLREITDTYWKEREGEWREAQQYNSMRSLEDVKKMDELTKRGNRSINSTVAQIESVLTTEQMQVLRKLVFHRLFEMMLMNRAPADQEAVSLTPEQKRKMQDIDRELGLVRQRAFRQTADRILAMLNPQQLQRARVEVEYFYRTAREPAIEKGAENDSGFTFSNMVVMVPKLDAASDDDATGGGWALPIYEDLGEGSVRKTLGMTMDQRKQLQKIADAYRSKMEGPANTAKKGPSATAVRQQIESLLTPQQLTMLKEIVFRRTLPDCAGRSQVPREDAAHP